MATVESRYRLRAIHRTMSFTTFERTIPYRPGWKREYYDGKAHVRPSWISVQYILTLRPRIETKCSGLRPLRAVDFHRLEDAFFDAFRYAPEYADYSLLAYRKKPSTFLNGFFGDVRGTPSPASTVIVRDRQIAAAALIKERVDRPPLLDCLFVRPAYFRQGLATAVVSSAVNQLLEAGANELRSSAMLANTASLCWHTDFGFEEVPHLFVAQARYFSTIFERDRLREIGKLSEAEAEKYEKMVAAAWEQLQRVDALPIESKLNHIDEF